MTPLTTSETRLLTETRMTTDVLLATGWRELGAVVSGREVYPDGIRYSLLLPSADLRLSLTVARGQRPLMLVALSARSRSSVSRTTATLIRPFDGGFEGIASELLSDGASAALAAALPRLATKLLDHPSFGRGIRSILPAA